MGNKDQSTSGVPYQWLENKIPLLSLIFVVSACLTILIPQISLEEYWFKDLMFKSRVFWNMEDDPSKEIAHVDIDDQSLRDLKALVMDRKLHQAPVMKALKDLGVNHVVLDIEFFDPVQPRIKVGASEKLAKSIDPLIEKIASIEAESDFEKQGEIGLALNPLRNDINNLEEDPNEDFGKALNEVTTTIGMHYNTLKNLPSQLLQFHDTHKTIEKIAKYNTVSQNTTEVGGEKLVLVPPHKSLYDFTDPKKVGWGLVNADSSEDGIVRTTKLYYDVGNKRYLHLSLRAYIHSLGKTPDDVVISENTIQIGNIHIPTMKDGTYRINWNSRFLKDEDLKIPFVRVHDLKTAEVAGRTYLKRALSLEEALYTQASNKGDYWLKRNKVFDINTATAAELLDAANNLKPMAPLTQFSTDIQTQIDRAKKNLLDWQEHHNKLKWLQDKTVFIGSAGTSSIDRRPSPIMPNVAMVNLHSTVFDSLSNQQHIRDLPSWLEALGAFILLMIIAVFTFKTAPIKSAAFALAISGLVLLTGLILFENGWFLTNGGSLIEFCGWTNAGITSIKEFVELKQKKYLKTLSPHLSEEAVKYIEENPQLELIGQRQMSVLFSDIEGFTAFTEGMKPNDIRLNVNRIMDALIPVIFEFNGTFDKFMGDRMMAFFGAPMPFEDHAQRACHCALKMKETLAKLSKDFVAEGLKPLTMTFGISTGEMSYGNFGSSDQFDLTVLGPMVNKTSRLQSMAKFFGATILIGETTFDDVKDKFNTKPIEQSDIPFTIHELISEKKLEELKKVDAPQQEIKPDTTQGN